jgi:hypothetical protein
VDVVGVLCGVDSDGGMLAVDALLRECENLVCGRVDVTGCGELDVHAVANRAAAASS